MKWSYRNLCFIVLCCIQLRDRVGSGGWFSLEQLTASTRWQSHGDHRNLFRVDEHSSSTRQTFTQTKPSFRIVGEGSFPLSLTLFFFLLFFQFFKYLILLCFVSLFRTRRWVVSAYSGVRQIRMREISPSPFPLPPMFPSSSSTLGFTSSFYLHDLFVKDSGSGQISNIWKGLVKRWRGYLHVVAVDLESRRTTSVVSWSRAPHRKRYTSSILLLYVPVAAVDMYVSIWSVHPLKRTQSFANCRTSGTVSV